MSTRITPRGRRARLLDHAAAVARVSKSVASPTITRISGRTDAGMALMSSSSACSVTRKPAIVSISVTVSCNSSCCPMTRACQPNVCGVLVSVFPVLPGRGRLSSRVVSWSMASSSRLTAAESQVWLVIIHCSASRAIWLSSGKPCDPPEPDSWCRRFLSDAAASSSPAASAARSLRRSANRPGKSAV